MRISKNACYKNSQQRSSILLALLFSRETGSTWSCVLGTLYARVNLLLCAFYQAWECIRFRKSSACSLCLNISQSPLTWFVKDGFFFQPFFRRQRYVWDTGRQIEGGRRVQSGTPVRESSFEKWSCKNSTLVLYMYVSCISAEMLNILTSFNNSDIIKLWCREHVTSRSPSVFMVE